MEILDKMRREMLRRKYSPRTINTYLHCVRSFINQNHKDVRKYSKKDIREYLEKISLRGRSGSTINVNLQALKFMMEQVLRKRVWIRIKYSKDDRKRLPEFLTKEELKKLFDAIKNRRHLLMIKLMYGAGLRVSEVLHLKVKDLQLGEGYGWIRKGKGNKDRPFIIPTCLQNELKQLIQEKPSYFYLFPGRRGHLNVGTVRSIIQSATKEAKIKKNVHPHTLRHSFATHLIEDGYAVTSIQTLLGHNSPDTSMIYVHMKPQSMIKVKSPLDK